LGVRIALGDIVELGLATAGLVVGSMAITLWSGIWIARRAGLGTGYGALAGAATAVCGASAALATATALPNYPRKSADVTFTVIAANAISTLCMVAYPPFCLLLGLDDRATGALLGATIHDMAQVVGAGYAVSEPVGNTAVIVKLFRVFLLLPVVLAVGWWCSRMGAEQGAARAPTPVFAIVFLALAVVNSVVPSIPLLSDVYPPVKAALIFVSSWGLLIAISALGLGTSLTAIVRIGWRHAAVFAAITAVLLGVFATGLLTLRL
jgi:uncharacterized integral membrane protein (TIGR00698 family)